MGHGDEGIFETRKYPSASGSKGNLSTPPLLFDNLPRVPGPRCERKPQFLALHRSAMALLLQGTREGEEA